MSEVLDEDEMRDQLAKYSSEELIYELKQRFDNYIYYFLNTQHRHDSDEYNETQMDWGGYSPQLRWVCLRN